MSGHETRFAQVLQRSAFGLMAAFGLLGSLFVIGVTMDDPGGMEGAWRRRRSFRKRLAAAYRAQGRGRQWPRVTCAAQVGRASAAGGLSSAAASRALRASSSCAII